MSSDIESMVSVDFGHFYLSVIEFAISERYILLHLGFKSCTYWCIFIIELLIFCLRKWMFMFMGNFLSDMMLWSCRE